MSTIAALTKSYGGCETDPEQIAHEHLERACRLADGTATFTQLTPELAMSQARSSAERWRSDRARGSLDGVPLTWKDVFDIEGFATTCGSQLTPRGPAVRDAACVARLRAAGAVIVGKTNLSEFAFSGLGLNPHFGTPLQQAPKTGQAHLVGGSSSGAASALRHGIGCVALGTDTSGSIRVPAAWSGLVGFRPSLRRYSSEGVARLAPSLDTVGVLAQNVVDVCAVDRVLNDGARAHHSDVHFVLVENFCGTDVQDEVRNNVCTVMSRLSDAGFRCERLRSETFDRVAEAFRRYGTLVAAEAAHELEPWLHDDAASMLDPFVLHRLREARAMPAHSLVALLQLRTALLHEIADEPTGRVYVFPTVPHTAPALASMDTLKAQMEANRDALRHTMPGSFLDMPGIALPSGHDEAGLPTSVLLSCSRGNDELLLAVALQLERRRIV